MVVHARVRFTVFHRRSETAPAFKQPNELVGEAEDRFLRSRARTVASEIDPAYRTRQASNRTAATEPIPLDKCHFHSLPGRGYGSGNARCPRAHHKHVGRNGEAFSAISCSNGHS